MNTQQHSKYRPVLLIVVVVLLFGVGAVVAYRRITAPTIGVIGQPPQATVLVSSSPKLIKGDYAQFMLPSMYELKDTVPETNSLEKYIFSGKPMDERQLAITVATMPPSGYLEDDSSYRTRQLRPETYTEETYLATSGPIVTMKHKSKFEWVSYLVKEDLLAVVALSSKDPEPKQLAQEYTDLINSWQWIER